MTLANMRALGVQRLFASCLNDACRHLALIDVWSYAGETEFRTLQQGGLRKMRQPGRHIDVRPNWKEHRRHPA